MTYFNTSCLGSCAPVQILSLTMPVNDASQVAIYDRCNVQYDTANLKYSYSVDGACWSCYMSLDELTVLTLDTVSDYFIRMKVPGSVSSVTIAGEESEYTVSLDSSFNLDASCDSSSQYNPYANIDGALQLQQALSNTVVCTVGIPVYYFKVNGVKASADITFKEYALKSVSAVKQIKLVISDGQMPSSRPEFADIGLDWQTDWETEISKSMFATAFGVTAQPTEGDLIYIPLMKRMWMVNEAYDEKNGSLMWQSTTWRVMLVKYQADASVDLNGNDSFVEELVKNTYGDLFGNEEPLGSGTESVQLTRPRPANLYPVFKSDATRKEMTCDTVQFQTKSLYHKGTLVMDSCYSFSPPASQIIYQRQYCGNELSISFLIHCGTAEYEAALIETGHIKTVISQTKEKSELYINCCPECRLTLTPNEWYFVTARFSKTLHICDMSAALYSHPQGIPLYQLANWHYYFDVDNAQQSTARWNSELELTNKSDIIVNGFYGSLSNIKVLDVYNDNVSELMMQYPNNQHLLVNDTARQLYGLLGVTAK